MLLKKVLNNISRLNLGSAIQSASRSTMASAAASSSSSPLFAKTSLLLANREQSQQYQVANFSLLTPRLGLMEFFDDKKNWTEMIRVKHGRPWRVDELRLKSNVELHQLWYVLHKERNMLLTMEEFYIQQDRTMPSHERIAKVKIKIISLLC